MKQELEKIKPSVERIFNHLHENPEISWKEYETTSFLAEQLKKIDVKHYTFSTIPGVIAEMGDGNQTVALRADIDGLWQEIDGIYRANHSCGHDAHMTMVLGTILLLKELGFTAKNKLKFIFQPAEEKAEGALALIDHGVMNDVDYLYGVHLRPKHEAVFGQASAAIKHGAGQFISGKIIGTSTHAARPHLGQNAIEVGAALIQHFNGIRMNPQIPFSVTMTSFQAGENQHNTVPGNGTFALDLRAQTNEAMIELKKKVENVVEKVAALFHVRIDLSPKGYFAAAEVNEQAKLFMEKAIVQTVGQEGLIPVIESPGGEDFHFYTLKNRRIKATMLGLGCDLTPGLHHPQMTFNSDAIMTGIEILARTLIQTCNEI